MIDKKQVKIVNQVKDLVSEVFSQNTRYDSRLRFSALLSEKLHLNYDSISEVFSRVEGITLEKYIITRRLEKVKELLVSIVRPLCQQFHRRMWKNLAFSLGRRC